MSATVLMGCGSNCAMAYGSMSIEGGSNCVMKCGSYRVNESDSNCAMEWLP